MNFPWSQVQKELHIMSHAVAEGQGIQEKHNAHLLCRVMDEMMFSSLNPCGCSCFKVCFEIGDRLLPSPHFWPWAYLCLSCTFFALKFL